MVSRTSESTVVLRDDRAIVSQAIKDVFDFDFQKVAAKNIFNRFTTLGHKACLLLGGVGTGKTYVLAEFLQHVFNNKFLDKKTISPYPIFYVTKASVVEQTERVLKQYGLDTVRHIQVTNYDQLRARLGDMFIREETKVRDGEPYIVYHWKKVIHPCIIIWDECQSLMNLDSQQSRIAQAVNDIESEHIYQVFSSASPFVKVSGAKCFAVATRTKHKYGYISSALVNEHFTDFAAHIAAPSHPDEHSPSAVKRLMEVLEPYVERIKNVRPKFHARNRVQLINFANEKERQTYDIAFEEFQRKLIEIGRNPLAGLAEIWVALLIFRQTAELIRAPYLADAAFESVKLGQAAVIAVNFKATVAKIIEVLVNKHKVPREKISTIWGGLDKKAKDNLKEQFKDLDLGTQSRKQRQKEIDKFQNGDSHYCIFTFKSGGVGLSLHHHKPHLRQRVSFVAPTYSAIELVQGLGRAPRLTSLSDTPQTIVFYRDTVEEEVAAKVEIKLRCLKEVVQQKEQWSDILEKKATERDGSRVYLPEGSRTIDINSNDDEDDDAMDDIYIEDTEDNEGCVIDLPETETTTIEPTTTNEDTEIKDDERLERQENYVCEFPTVWWEPDELSIGWDEVDSRIESGAIILNRPKKKIQH